MPPMASAEHHKPYRCDPANMGSRHRVLGPLLAVLTAAAGGFAYTLYINWPSVGYPVIEPVRARISERLRERELERRARRDPVPGASLPSAAGGAPEPAARIADFTGGLSCCVGNADEAARYLA